MKNLVYALVGAGFMIACQPSDQPEISGMLTGIESDTLLVQSFPVNDRDSRRTDTIAMQNGSFAFNLGDSGWQYTCHIDESCKFFAVAWPTYKNFRFIG